MGVKQSLLWEDEPVLEYEIELPELPEKAKRLGRYLRKTEQVWTKYWEKKVYPKACQMLSERRAASKPFPIWQARLVGETTYQGDDLYSLKLEARELRGDGCPCLVCWGEVWDLKQDVPVPVENLFVPSKGWEKRALEQIYAAGEEKQRGFLWVPDENWREKAKKALKACSPWVGEKQVFLSFPQGFLASAAEGTPVFGVERESLSI